MTLDDSQVELQSYIELAEKETRTNVIKHSFLKELNNKMIAPTKVQGNKGEKEHVFDLLEFELRTLPSPCSLAHVMPCVESVAEAMPAGIIDAECVEALQAAPVISLDLPRPPTSSHELPTISHEP